MAAKWDLHMDQGETWVRNFAVQDADEEPLDITGASVTMEARLSMRSTSTLFSVSTGGGEITLDGDDGVISVVIPSATTAQINQSGLYAIEITYSTGETERLLEGKLILHPEVVR